MTAATSVPSDSRALRLWPGVLLAAAIVIAYFLMPLAMPDTSGAALLVGAVAAVLIVAWWLLFSRAPRIERLGALVLMAAAVIVTQPFLHPSVAGAGMGVLFYVMSLTLMAVALVAWAVVSRRLARGARWATLGLALALACGTQIIVRTEGIRGAGGSDLRWRWTPTAEERLLEMPGQVFASVDAAPSSTTPAPPASPTTPPAAAPAAAEQPAAATMGVSSEPAMAAEPNASAPVTPLAEWPGFRGASRDSILRDTRFDTDWAARPPTLLWKHAIGPGWSSFAVAGDRIYTQEQRGDEELVTCYALSTGAPIWAHANPVRFYESNGGAGPRGTPSVADGRVFAFGATGIVNALDASTGRLLWSHQAAEELGKAVPGWGFASSPLVVDDLVVVAVSGQLVAFDAATGAERWRSPSRGGGYSSPHLAEIAGVRQVLLLSGGGAMSVFPADGTLLWDHTWETGASIVQPAVLENGNVIVGGVDMMGGIGLRRLDVSRDDGGAWRVDVRWTTRGLKPYFNDFVVHDGHAYGFDGTILSAIDLADGTRRWKGGRYGAGQMLLLPDQDLLLVLSEEGELALVQASPDGFAEVARAPAIEGKTWNHPVLIGDVLLVRNGEQMAAFRLAGALSTQEQRE